MEQAGRWNAHADACAVLQMSVLQMHGTGTALGDPIEMNAALTALVGPGSKAALQFSAHKASCGHAEPSAGTSSLVHHLSLWGIGAASCTADAGHGLVAVQWCKVNGYTGLFKQHCCGPELVCGVQE